MERYVRIIIAILFTATGSHAIDIVQEPRNTSALVGTNVTLACQITNQQFSEDVMWKRVLPTGESYILSWNQLTEPTNTTHHTIQGTYNLTILGVTVADEGTYVCDVTNVRSMAVTLSVGDVGGKLRMFWPNDAQSVASGKTVNLTCRAERARPLPVYRWYLGDEDVSSSATTISGPADKDGYMSSYSVLPVTPDLSEDFKPVTCVADLAGVPDAMSASLRIQLSGADHVQVSRLLQCIVGLLSMLYLMNA